MTNVCASSELDLFVRPPVQTSILSSRWVEYTPIVNFDKGNTPIQIEVTGTKGESSIKSVIPHKIMQCAVIPQKPERKTTHFIIMKRNNRLVFKMNSQ